MPIYGILEYLDPKAYRDVYADTGGVPVPNDVNDGSYINYSSADLVDPAWNTSGVPGRTLYYEDNYPRLRQAKARWGPEPSSVTRWGRNPPDVRPRRSPGPFYHLRPMWSWHTKPGSPRFVRLHRKLFAVLPGQR